MFSAKLLNLTWGLIRPSFFLFNLVIQLQFLKCFVFYFGPYFFFLMFFPLPFCWRFCFFAFKCILQSNFFFNLTLILLIFFFVKAIFQFNLTLHLKNFIFPLINAFFSPSNFFRSFCVINFFPDFIFQHLFCQRFGFMQFYRYALVF